jgi:hypothetical protein
LIPSYNKGCLFPSSCIFSTTSVDAISHSGSISLGLFYTQLLYYWYCGVQVESFDQVRWGSCHVGNYDLWRASQAQCDVSVERAVFPGPVLDSYCYHDGFAKCGMALSFSMLVYRFNSSFII